MTDEWGTAVMDIKIEMDIEVHNKGMNPDNCQANRKGGNTIRLEI